ncbi:uncharacterized protein AKAW2_31086S [Aspergillus luchuensis]|uniref:Uncharacterized protein n=1 Tax=Aspergillus kawachii TaxID=1069201 RepID=A0A7R7W7F6_ASPKA|nr:uncharacterized protein AKAW2_31086S [Aspergillus luchuensis]BCR97767.1 hypothetical protein AKAW2_31086S [Aspergillus luchuensis]
MGLVLARVESPLWARVGTAQLPALKQIIFSLQMIIDDGMVTYHIWTCNVRSEHGPLGGGRQNQHGYLKRRGADVLDRKNRVSHRIVLVVAKVYRQTGTGGTRNRALNCDWVS